MRLEERSRMESRTIVCYLGGIWRRLEPLGRIYGRFLRRIRRSLRWRPQRKPVTLQKKKNGNRSAHGPHRRDVTHSVSKVSCFLLETCHYRRLQNEKRQVFFTYKSLYFERFATMPMLIFRAWDSCGVSIIE